MKKNILFKNSITKSFNNKSLHSKSKKNLNSILKKVFGTLDIKKDTLHVLSKKLDLDFNLSELKKFKKYESVILIGMGGSILGTQAIYSFLKEKINKKFIFLNNLDQIRIERIKKKINLTKNLFIIISKSGNTLETLINSNLFKDKINYKNTIIITEKKK